MAINLEWLHFLKTILYLNKLFGEQIKLNNLILLNYYQLLVHLSFSLYIVIR